MGRIIDQTDVFGDVMGGPAARHQFLARLGGIGRGTDGRDDLIHIGYGHGQTTEDMAAVTGLAQFKRGAARDDLFAEVDEGRQELAQGQLFRATAVQRQHVRAKAGLHLGEAEQLVQDDLGRGVAFQLDHNTDADAVGFVLDAADTFEFLFADQFGDLFDHIGLVHLIGNFVQNNRIAVLADFLDPRFGADDD